MRSSPGGRGPEIQGRLSAEAKHGTDAISKVLGGSAIILSAAANLSFVSGYGENGAIFAKSAAFAGASWVLYRAVSWVRG